jgi:hypothetical protein
MRRRCDDGAGFDKDATHLSPPNGLGVAAEALMPTRTGSGRGTPLVPVAFEPGIMGREGGHHYEEH